MKILKLLRVHNGIIGSLGVLVGALCLPEFPEYKLIILGMLSIIFFIMGGNVQNDLEDIETDKVSHPDRVLVQNTYSKISLVLFYLTLYAAGLAACFVISWQHGLLGVFIVLFLTLYNFQLKNFNLFGNLTVALLSGIPLFLLEWPQLELTIIPFLFAFLTSLLREVIKDAQDMVGDVLAQRNTFPIKYGILPTKVLILSLVGLISILIIMPYFYFGYHFLFLTIGVLLIFPTLGLCLFYIIREVPNWSTAQQIVKLIMLEGILAISLGVSLV